MSCYTYNIILKLFHFWLKYNGLAIVRKTTKLIEGGHRGLQDYRHILLFTSTFFTFSFQNPKSRDFLRFFAVFHTFSRTMLKQLISEMMRILHASGGSSESDSVGIVPTPVSRPLTTTLSLFPL